MVVGLRSRVCSCTFVDNILKTVECREDRSQINIHVLFRPNIARNLENRNVFPLLICCVQYRAQQPPK